MLLHLHILIGVFCDDVLIGFWVGCMGSFSCVDSVMVCLRFLIAMMAGNWCFIIVIGVLGIGDLCLWREDSRVIELFIISMAILSVILWSFVGVNCVKGRRRRGWFTRARSRVLVSEIDC